MAGKTIWKLRMMQQLSYLMNGLIKLLIHLLHSVQNHFHYICNGFSRKARGVFKKILSVNFATYKKKQTMVLNEMSGK